jgi:hypothetical protein
MAADNPKTGRSDGPSLGSSIGGIGTIFTSIVKGAVSVFNNPPDVTPIDVIRASPAWNDPVRLQRTRDTWENKPFPKVRKQQDSFRRGRDRLLNQIDDRLEILRAREPGTVDQGEEPSSTVSDQQTSPVFRSPGSIGIGGGVLLGVGGMSGASEELRKKVEQKLKQQAAQKKVRAYRARYGPMKLPKSNLEKAAAGALKVLNKVPKGLLPDSELITVAKTFGKALRGGFGGLAAQVAGTYAIEKGAAVIAKRQFEQMTNILRPGDAYQIAQARKAAKGPTTRGGRRSNVASEPSRPRPPAPPGPAGQVARAPRAPRAPGRARPAPGPLEKIEEVKVTAIKYATPGQMAQARFPTTAKGGITRSQVILGAAKALGSVGNAALFGRIGRTSRGSSTSNNFAPSSQSGAQFLTNTSAKSQTTAASNCYTVCRKKSTGKKKRAKPRICISPSKASRLGII